MRTFRATAVAAVGLVGLVAVTGCENSSKGGEQIAVTATDTECQVARTDLPAGGYTFAVRNGGTKVTEFYVYGKGDKVVGEVEDISPGVTRKLNVDLTAGEYQAACKPGMKGNGIRVKLTVTGQARSLAEDPALAAAVTSYRGYVAREADALQSATAAFVAAVKAGDVAQARSRYPIARMHWERIEPVAESFGDLDASIDARENDVEDGAEWTGFHRIEKELWVTGSVAAVSAVADRLLSDVGQVVTQAKAAELTPTQLANGSKELLDEVATSKITGEEERYSGTDLYDFAANVEGAKAAVDALRDTVGQRDAALLRRLDAGFAGVEAALARHRVGTGWRRYTELSAVDVKQLSDAINALAEPVSQVGALVVRR